MAVVDIVQIIEGLIADNRIYAVERYDEHMDLDVVGVEVDPDGDIKLITEVRQ